MTLKPKINSNVIRTVASLFKIYIGLTALSICISVGNYSCTNGCKRDSQCNHDRVCMDGECVVGSNYNPNQNNYFSSEDIISDVIIEDNIISSNDPCPDPKHKSYLDFDNDGFGNDITWICEEAPGFVKDNSDCDDNDTTVYPNAPELCDGKKNDCNNKDELSENMTRSCQSICGEGVEMCINGAWSECKTDLSETVTRPCQSICGEGVEKCINEAWSECKAKCEEKKVCVEEGCVYDKPVGAEDTWKSLFDTVGLCFNEFNECYSEMQCKYITKINGKKPDLLTFLDPAYSVLDITITSDINEEETIEFTKTESGVVRGNGFFDSVVWYSTQNKYIAADYVGETVDILLLDYVPITEDTLCELAYNFPCSEPKCN